MRDNSVIEKYCWENSAANCDGDGGVMKRGGMYEWEEAVQQWSGPVVLPVRGICPEGWHVPSNNEWRILTLHLGGAAAYIAMIEGGSSGFDALFTGYRDEMSGKFSPGYATDEARASFWAADPASGDRTQIVQVGPSEIRVLPVARPNGICVRCIYDGPRDKRRGCGFTNGSPTAQFRRTFRTDRIDAFQRECGRCGNRHLGSARANCASIENSRPARRELPCGQSLCLRGGTVSHAPA
jgi:uncharacterized protein (TIGR02145 family)